MDVFRKIMIYTKEYIRVINIYVILNMVKYSEVADGTHNQDLTIQPYKKMLPLIISPVAENCIYTPFQITFSSKKLSSKNQTKKRYFIHQFY